MYYLSFVSKSQSDYKTWKYNKSIDIWELLYNQLGYKPGGGNILPAKAIFIFDFAFLTEMWPARRY